MFSKSTALLCLSLLFIIGSTKYAEAQAEYLVLEKTFKKKQIEKGF